MAEQLAVAAKARRERGKNAARRLRAAGQIPAVVYGSGSEALSLAVDPRQIQEILHSPGGYNTLFDLKVEGKSTNLQRRENRRRRYMSVLVSWLWLWR